MKMVEGSSSSSFLSRSLPTPPCIVETTLQDTRTILCCVCGVSGPSNPSRMCVTCLREEVDITKGISRQVVLPYCKQCERYLLQRWIRCNLESAEMLALCLKKVRGLQQVRLGDAAFLWTEPHSKRLRVKLTVQKEVLQGAVLQQSFSVEFILQSTQCDECKRSWTPHTWSALVQVRQRTDHKRTLLFLEQVILKNDAHERVLNVEDKSDGLDFQFESRQDAFKFVEFISHQLPSKWKTSRQLVSHDASSNTHQIKHVFALTICPLCKDDLVYLPPKVASLFGGVSPFLLLLKVSTVIHLVDPVSGRKLEVSQEKYWKNPFVSILRRHHLTEFIILDVDDRRIGHPSDDERGSVTVRQEERKKPGSARKRLASTNKQSTFTKRKARSSGTNARGEVPSGLVEIARVCDFGSNDERLLVQSHIAGSLKAGDIVLGYDIRTINLAGLDEELLQEHIAQLQGNEVLLFRKKPNRPKDRIWTLRGLQKRGGEAEVKEHRGKQSLNRDIEMLKDDLEENPDMRKHVNLYINPKYQKAGKNRKAKPCNDTDMSTDVAENSGRGDTEILEEAPSVRRRQCGVVRRRQCGIVRPRAGFEVLKSDSEDDERTSGDAADDYSNYIKLSELIEELRIDSDDGADFMAMDDSAECRMD